MAGVNFQYPLMQSTNVLVSGGAGTFTGAPANNQGYYTALAVQFTLTAVPTGGSPTLDLYLQDSMDGGNTWQDLANIHYTTPSVPNNQFVFISGYVTGGTAPVAASDGALTANSVVQRPWGDRLRIKYKLGLAGGESGQYTFAVWVVPKGWAGF